MIEMRIAVAAYLAACGQLNSEGGPRGGPSARAPLSKCPVHLNGVAPEAGAACARSEDCGREGLPEGFAIDTRCEPLANGMAGACFIGPLLDLGVNCYLGPKGDEYCNAILGEFYENATARCELLVKCPEAQPDCGQGGCVAPRGNCALPAIQGNAPLSDGGARCVRPCE